MRNLIFLILVFLITKLVSNASAATVYATCFEPTGKRSSYSFGQINKDDPDAYTGASWHYIFDTDTPDKLKVYAQSTQSDGISAKEVAQLAGTKWDEEFVMAADKGLIRSFGQYGFQWWITNLDVSEKKLYAVRSTGNPETALGGRHIVTAYYWADCEVEIE